MAFRAFDPCFSCATHSLPGEMPLQVSVHQGGALRTEFRRGC
jgi:coenzyme F420-reducing hydrogenase alpha subunit